MSLMMTIRIAFKALARNKLRTALTMLGMIIGVGAVIAMVALGSGAQAQIEDQVKSQGTNMLTIMPGSSNAGGVRTGFGGNTRLIPEDAQAIRDIPEIQYVSEMVSTRAQIINGGANWNTNIQGTSVDMPAIRAWPMKYGSFFTEEDIRSSAKVIVLGSNVADKLFDEGTDPTDTNIRVKNQIFHVLGVMSPKGAAAGGGGSQDDSAFAPYTTVMQKLSGQQNLNNIIAATRSAEDVQKAADAVGELLHQRHNLAADEPNDVIVQTLDDIIALRSQTTETMRWLLFGVALVSLVVGGIGIMNIMLVSVTERTREIGLRMAIGARGSDVLLQFLIEAVVISAVGGAIGIASGFGASQFITWWMAWPTLVPLDSVILATLVSAFVGIFFGFYPARKAAGLDPIEALRFE